MNSVGPVFFNTIRRFSSIKGPSQWKNLTRLKTPQAQHVVKVDRGGVTDIYNKEPSGDVSKSVEHRFASVPKVLLDVKDVPKEVLIKLGIIKP